MEAVAVKDIPRELLIGASLKDELLGDRKLKPTEAAEKIVLPSAEDVKNEKSHRNILSGKSEKYLSWQLNKTFYLAGIEAFKSDELKHAETKEKLILPGAEEIQTEKTIQGLLQGVESFEAEKLRAVKTRQPASPSSILQVELARDSSLTAVNDFDKTCLRPAETAEKNSLPSSKDIEQEMEHIKFKVKQGLLIWPNKLRLLTFTFLTGRNWEVR